MHANHASERDGVGLEGEMFVSVGYPTLARCAALLAARGAERLPVGERRHADLGAEVVP
jgi:hypothetical protein